MVYSTRRFAVCLSVCHFVLVFFSPFSIAITSLGEEKANLSAFRTFFRFVLVWICQFPLPLGVWEGLRFVIVALPGLFSYLFFFAGHEDSQKILDEVNFWTDRTFLMRVTGPLVSYTYNGENVVRMIATSFLIESSSNL